MKTLRPHTTLPAPAEEVDHEVDAVTAAHLRLLSWIIGEPEEVTARRLAALLPEGDRAAA